MFFHGSSVNIYSKQTAKPKEDRKLSFTKNRYGDYRMKYHAWNAADAMKIRTLFDIVW